MILNHNILVNYFSDLATQLKSINSFFRMNLTEIMGAFRSTAEFPCMVIESHEGDFGDSTPISSINNIAFGFTIYTNPDNDDYDAQNQDLATAEEIGIKILARMRHDATQPNHILYNRFKIETVTYSKVGPIFNEQLYGYRFVGAIRLQEPLTVNPDDWDYEPNICTS